MLKKKTIEILNDARLLAEKERVFSVLKNFYDGKSLEKTVNLNGLVFFPQGVDPYTEPEKWVDAALDFMAEHAERIADKNILRPLAVEFGPYGVHFTDKILGAKVSLLDGQWNSEYLKTEIGTLQAPDLTNNETFQLAKRTAEYFVSLGVKLPVFGLPTIASCLNVAVNLYGDEVFYAFYDNEEGIRHDLKVINDLIIQLHAYYRSAIPADQLQPVVSWERTQPYGCGQICGCSTQMLSPELYREFVLKLDDAVLAVYDNPGMLHLCGTHLHHAESFAAMPHLKTLQLHNRAAEDMGEYLAKLRSDQTLYVNCCPEMPYEKALAVSGGERVVFVGEYPSAPRRK